MADELRYGERLFGNGEEDSIYSSFMILLA